MMTEVVCLLICLLAIFSFSANVLCSFFYWLIRAFLIIEFQELFSLLNCKNSQMTNARNEPSVICVTNIFSQITFSPLTLCIPTLTCMHVIHFPSLSFTGFVYFLCRWYLFWYKEWGRDPVYFFLPKCLASCSKRLLNNWPCPHCFETPLYHTLAPTNVLGSISVLFCSLDLCLLPAPKVCVSAVLAGTSSGVAVRFRARVWGTQPCCQPQSHNTSISFQSNPFFSPIESLMRFFRKSPSLDHFSPVEKFL